MIFAYGLGTTMGMGLSVATATSIITSDIVSKTISITINSLSSTLSYMSESSENFSIKKYHNELEKLDIQFKFKLIQSWLNNHNSEFENVEVIIDNVERNNRDIENSMIVSQSNIEPTRLLLYNGIKDICIKINKSIEVINSKIKEHQLKWFHTYRNLSLDEEIDDIQKYNKILNERIYLSILK